MFYEHIEGDSIYNTLAYEGWECESDLESELMDAGFIQDETFSPGTFDTFWYDVKDVKSRWVNGAGDAVYIIEA
jgi:hypothetical protein